MVRVVTASKGSAIMSMPAPAPTQPDHQSDTTQRSDPRIDELFTAIRSADVQELTTALERIVKGQSVDIFGEVRKAGLFDAFVDALIARGAAAGPDDAWNRMIDERLKEIDSAINTATDESAR